MRTVLAVGAAAAALATLLTITAGGPASAQAADASVAAENTTFEPPVITIPAGGTVTWTNTDQVAHTVTADDGSFASGFLAAGESVSVTFDAPGTYAYYCIPHGAPGGLGMAGVLVVQ
jgi:plastocyanin